MNPNRLKIGEFARETGVSVRTLHYYEELRLLIPFRNEATGYRFYTAEDLGRLQMIRSLQQLGFSLKEIQAELKDQKENLSSILPNHIAQLRDRIQLERELCSKLERMWEALRDRKEVSATDLLLTLKLTNMTDSYFNSEQMAKIKAQGEKVGPERIQEVENAWPVLIAKVKAHIEKGTDPKDPEVQELAKEWMGLVSEFTGGDPTIMASLNTMYQNERPKLQEEFQDSVPTAGMYEYIQKALA